MRRDAEPTPQQPMRVWPILYDQAAASGLVDHPDACAAFFPLGALPLTGVGTAGAFQGTVPSIGTLTTSNRCACLQPPRMVSARSVTRLAFGRWLRSGTRARPLRAPCFKGIKRSRRIATWASSDKLYHLLKLVRPELGRDLVDATLMEQQNSCYDRFGHTLGGGSPHRLTMKFDSENIGHGWNISCQHVAPSGGLWVHV